MAKKSVLIILADGFEEVEAITTFDILKRAGLDVKLAGVESREIISGRGLKIKADLKLDELRDEPDAVVLPGGSLGAENLSKSSRVKKLIMKMNEDGKIVAAICAAPAVVLAPLGVLNGKRATCFPGMEKMFASVTVHSDEEVVVDGNIVTSKGAGTAFKFGLKLAELIAGKARAEDVKKKMLL